MLPLQTHASPHTLAPAPNHPLLVPFAFHQQQLVQFIPVPYLRHWHQVIPPVKTVLSFHAAFLVPLPRGTELRPVSPVRPERDEPFRLFPPAAPQNPFH